MTLHSLRRHDTSLSHVEAKKLELQLCLSKKDGGIQQAFTAVESAERKAMKATMKCLYWLAKHEIPHLTAYRALTRTPISYYHRKPLGHPQCSVGNRAGR